MNTLGLIIGRFQPLHKGHILLIEKSLQEHPTTLILIGSSENNDEINPYSFEIRKDFIEGEFPEQEISIIPLPDCPNDSDWIQQILSYIPSDIKNCTLYCGDQQNDYAVQVLKEHTNILPFTLDILEVDRKSLPISGTQVRKNIEKHEIKQLKESLGATTFQKLYTKK